MEENKISKGWIVAYAALGVNLILGVLYSWSVFSKALIKAGWSPTDASLPMAVSALTFSIMMIFAGKIQDKFGPRLVVVIGGIVLGIGLIASGFANSPLLMSITFGAIGGFGIGFGYSATTPCAIKWFDPSKKGLISGIVVSGVGLSPVYMAPLTAMLLGKYGIQNTFIILGLIAIAAVVFFSLFLKNPPAGYKPQAVQNTTSKAAPAGVNYDWSEMIKTKQFYLLWIMYLLAATAGLMLIGHMAKIAKEQIGWEAGFILVVILSIFNASGRVFGGILSDKVGRTTAMLIVFVIQAINMFVFRFYTDPILLGVGAAVAGLSYGALFTLFPTTTADYFGVKNLGVNYGLVFTGWGIAGAFGPMIGGWVFKTTGTYNNSYIISGALLALAAIMIKFMKAPQKA